eukprot:2031885-Rhodomonas_salina.2
MWFIIFTDGVHCGPCRTAMTNGLRLSAGVAGLAQVGVVDCEEPDMSDLCYTTLQLPAPPHQPQVRVSRHRATALDPMRPSARGV